jgi:adenylate kinase family enzyme
MHLGIVLIAVQRWYGMMRKYLAAGHITPDELYLEALRIRLSYNRDEYERRRDHNGDYYYVRYPLVEEMYKALRHYHRLAGIDDDE